MIDTIRLANKNNSVTVMYIISPSFVKTKRAETYALSKKKGKPPTVMVTPRSRSSLVIIPYSTNFVKMFIFFATPSFGVPKKYNSQTSSLKFSLFSLHSAKPLCPFIPSVANATAPLD